MALDFLKDHASFLKINFSLLALKEKRKKTMKFLLPLLALLLSVNILEAKKISACDQKCFQQKYHCNIEKSYTYNSCSDELFTCRASCQSGKTQRSYANTTLPVEIAFYPMVTK